MTLLELAGGIFIICWAVWTLVLYLLQKCKIEDLERELKKVSRKETLRSKGWNSTDVEKIIELEG